jgi:hypothetical protein
MDGVWRARKYVALGIPHAHQSAYRPILLEVREREQEILDYLSRDLEQLIAS